MMSLVIGLLLTFFSLPAQVHSTEMSTNIATFMDYLNGNFSNEAQYKADNGKHGFTQLLAVPVFLPDFPHDFFIFGEWGFNGHVHMVILCKVTEDNGIINMQIYNISHIRKINKPGDFKMEDVANIKKEDLKTTPGCNCSFERDKMMYVGTFSACRFIIYDLPIKYTSIYECDRLTIVMPLYSKFDEKYTTVPYNLNLIGKKFDIPRAPPGFVKPCPNQH